jgi:hypothetical protein
MRPVLNRLGATVLCGSALLVAASSFGLVRPGFGGVATAAVYYLSPTGRDTNAGTTPAAAWRTLGRASQAPLRPGTRLLLQGGGRFAGTLVLGAADAGNAAHPVIVGSYGTGRATIVGARSGIVVEDTGGVEIHDLVITGRGVEQAGGAGINLWSDRLGQQRFSHIVITAVNVSGFTYGIAIGAIGLAGFRDVRIADSQLHGNLDAGIASFGPRFNPAAPAYAHAGISITRVLAARNAGDPRQTRNSTGSGIVLGSVDGARVALSTAFDNGGAGGGSQRGPIGIWAYDSMRVVIEHNLSYANRSGNSHDGGGFGLDQNTSLSYLQYNLSYDNWGAGYLLFSRLNNGACTGNVIRYNISSGDARTHIRSGGIVLTGWITRSAVYQNSVVLGTWTGALHAPLVIGEAVRSITIRNSVLATSRTGPVVFANAQLRPRQAGLQGNDYFSAARSWLVQWGGARYASLRAWRTGTGEEILRLPGARGRPAGFAVNPAWTGPVLGLTARSAANRGIGAGFALRRGSQMIGAGLDLLRLFGTNPGPVDFSGQRVPPDRPSVGAQQR